MPLVDPNVLSRPHRSRILPSEGVMIFYALGGVLVCALFQSRIPGWYVYAAGHAAVILVTLLLIGARSPFGRLARAFDLLVLVPVVFLMACQLIHRVHPVDYDPQLIAADRAIGGLAVLRWMGRIESPALTLVSKLAWISYYFIAVIPGVALYRRARKEEFEEAKLILALGWLSSYVIYFLVPAEGPGYHAEAVGVPQPAWDPASAKAKEWIYALEGEARDTFPSGHALIAALVIFLCLRNRLWISSLIAIPLSLGVIWSTLYLRYHYLSDVIAGLVLAALCAGVGVVWYRKHSEARIGG